MIDFVLEEHTDWDITQLINSMGHLDMGDFKYIKLLLCDASSSLSILSHFIKACTQNKGVQISCLLKFWHLGCHDDFTLQVM